MAFYGYPNTRVRAMKSQLLGQDFFEKLLGAGNTSEVISILGKTNYKQDIEKGLVKFPGSSGIEEGLKINIIKDFNKILRYIKGNSQAERLIKLILSRWDVHNLKTIFRGIHSEAEKGDISDQLMPVGQLDQAHLTVLLEQEDIKACIDLLAMWRFKIAQPLTEVYSEYKESKKLSILELVIDKYYFNFIISGISKLTLNRYNENLVREFTCREIDFVNLMTLFRLIREGIKNEEDIQFSDFFIDGGKELNVDQLVVLTEEPEVEDVVNKLKDSSYYPVLKEGLKKYHFTGSLSTLERKIEDHIIKQLVSLFKNDPLSIAIIIAFIWAKYNETVNLRIIVRCKDVEMPEDQIREALVFV